MYIDYHIHTVLCRHATGAFDDYLKQAEKVGLTEVGFAEHSYWMAGQGDDLRLCPTREEMDLYVEWVLSRQDEYNGKNGKPKLRLGIEADWLPEAMEQGQKYLDSNPFDYVICSVHHLKHPVTGFWNLSWDEHHMDPEEVASMYFEEVARLAESGFADIIGHIDVIRRAPLSIPEEVTAHYFAKVVDRIAASGVAVEINTSGLDHELGGLQPGEEILKMLIEAGVDITFGSDAHQAEAVGRYMDIAHVYLHRFGGTHFARFEKRKKILEKVVV